MHGTGEGGTYVLSSPVLYLLYDGFQAILAFACISSPVCKTGIATPLSLYLMTVKFLEGLKYEQK